MYELITASAKEQITKEDFIAQEKRDAAGGFVQPKAVADLLGSC